MAIHDFMEKIKLLTPDEIGWSAEYPDRLNCKMKTIFEKWCFTKAQSDKLHLNKVFEFLSHNAFSKADMDPSFPKYTNYAINLFLQYREFSETII